MDTEHYFLVSPLINSFSLIPCPGRTLVIAGMWHQGACLSWCGWLLMGDYTPNTSVIRAADLITHRHMIICFPCASAGAAPAHVCISARTDVVVRGASGASFSRLLVCSLSFFCLRRVFCASIHQSDKVSVRVRMKEPAKQIERKRKRQIEREKKTKKKTWTYSCLPVCLHLFVSLLSVCSPHSRRSALVTVSGDGEDKKGKIMCYICIIVSHKLAQRSL